MIVAGQNSKTESQWVHPFGSRYQERNQVELYLRMIFEAVDNDDGLGLSELFNELTHEQHIYINGLLASHTRKKIKELKVNCSEDDK